ncbi:hypothetical protein R6Q59_010553 [Mikania micrantha]
MTISTNHASTIGFKTPQISTASFIYKPAITQVFAPSTATVSSQKISTSIADDWNGETEAILVVNIYGCNMEKSVWENPEEWNPERFMKENETIDFQRTVAFGGGKRVCAGSLQAI